MIETNYNCNDEADSTTSAEPAVFIENITHSITEKDLRGVHELPQRYHSIFQIFQYFNLIQSKTFDVLLQTDRPVVVSAPTGSGKTVLFELAIIRLIELSGHEGATNNKIVYMAPVKALCAERYFDWQRKFEPLGLQAIEVTGDSNYIDLNILNNYNIILTTPEKWDSLTRRWRDYTALVQVIKLFLIDEVHLLSEEKRGPTLEAVVSRMKTVQDTLNTNSGEGTTFRFVAISATIPNIKDLAMWLGKKDCPAVYYKFGEEMRPVELKKVVIGYPSRNNITAFKFEMNLSYKMKQLILKYSNGKPTLIFCTTRKGVLQTVSVLLRDIAFEFNTEQRAKLGETIKFLLDNKLKEAIKHGIGYHHAGMITSDRNCICELFRNGSLPILVATSTLAMGVNLPAHLVIIKSTEQYVSGEWVEYSEGQLLQMIGRAGRPQFDYKATAVIMTRDSIKHKYERLVAGKEMVESNLHRHLVEFLNAEIVLGTITDICVTMNWIRSTFLYVRAFSNPKYYGIPGGLSKEETEAKLQDLCMRELNALEKYELVVKSNFAYNVQPTENGMLMARYYIAFETMKIFMQFGFTVKKQASGKTILNVRSWRFSRVWEFQEDKAGVGERARSLIKGTESIPELLHLISKCHEFSEIHLRVNERGTLNMLNVNKERDTIRFPLSGRIKTREMKANCLLQAALGSLQIHDPSLAQETAKVVNIAQRLLRGLSKYLWQRPHYKSLVNTLVLSKCLQCRLWENSIFLTRQLPGVGPALASLLASSKKTTFSDILKSNPRDLERITNRHPPFGNQLQAAAMRFPQYSLSIDYVPSHLKIVVGVTILNASELIEVGGSNHQASLIIADNNNEILKKEKIHDTAILTNGGAHNVSCILKCNPGDGEITVNLISDDIVGVDVSSSLKLQTNTKSKTIQTPIEMYGFKKKALPVQTKSNGNFFHDKPNPYKVNLKQFKYEPAQVKKFQHGVNKHDYNECDPVTSTTQEKTELFNSTIERTEDYLCYDNNIRSNYEEQGSDEDKYILDKEFHSGNTLASSSCVPRVVEKSHEMCQESSVVGAPIYGKLSNTNHIDRSRSSYSNFYDERNIKNIMVSNIKLNKESNKLYKSPTSKSSTNGPTQGPTLLMKSSNEEINKGIEVQLNAQKTVKVIDNKNITRIGSFSETTNASKMSSNVNPDQPGCSVKSSFRQPMILIPDDDVGCIELVCPSDGGHSPANSLSGAVNNVTNATKLTAKYYPIFFKGNKSKNEPIQMCTSTQKLSSCENNVKNDSDDSKCEIGFPTKEIIAPKKDSATGNEIMNKRKYGIESAQLSHNISSSSNVKEFSDVKINSLDNGKKINGSQNVIKSTTTEPRQFGEFSNDNQKFTPEREAYDCASTSKSNFHSISQINDSLSDSPDTDFSPDLETVTSGYESLREFKKANENKDKNKNLSNSDFETDFDTLLAEDEESTKENIPRNAGNNQIENPVSKNNLFQSSHCLNKSNPTEENYTFCKTNCQRQKSPPIPINHSRAVGAISNKNHEISLLGQSTIKQMNYNPGPAKSANEKKPSDKSGRTFIGNNLNKFSSMSPHEHTSDVKTLVYPFLMSSNSYGSTQTNNQSVFLIQDSHSSPQEETTDSGNKISSTGLNDIDISKCVKSKVFSRPPGRMIENGFSQTNFNYHNTLAECKRQKIGNEGGEGRLSNNCFLPQYQQMNSFLYPERDTWRQNDFPFASPQNVDFDAQSGSSKSLRSEYGDPYASVYSNAQRCPNAEDRDMNPSFRQLSNKPMDGFEISKYFAHADGSKSTRRGAYKASGYKGGLQIDEHCTKSVTDRVGFLSTRSDFPRMDIRRQYFTTRPSHAFNLDKLGPYGSSLTGVGHSLPKLEEVVRRRSQPAAPPRSCYKLTELVKLDEERDRFQTPQYLPEPFSPPKERYAPLIFARPSPENDMESNDAFYVERRENVQFCPSPPFYDDIDINQDDEVHNSNTGNDEEDSLFFGNRATTFGHFNNFY